MKKFRQFVNESEKKVERILSDKFIWILKHTDNNISNLILEYDFSKRYYLIDIDYNRTHSNNFLILCENRRGQIYNITIGKFINNIINVSNREIEDFVNKFKSACIEYICEKEPYNAYKYIEYLSDEQKEKYKEFITLDRDFDLFESYDDLDDDNNYDDIEKVYRQLKDEEYEYSEKLSKKFEIGDTAIIVSNESVTVCKVENHFGRITTIYSGRISDFKCEKCEQGVYTIDEFLNKYPHKSYKLERILTSEQKEKYKEFINLQKDFDLFESVDYEFDDYFNQIEEGEFDDLTDDLWDALTAEEWTNEEDRDDFLGDREKDDFKYIELKISKTDRFGLASMDDGINKKFMNFRIKLKEKYNLEYLDIIDYKEGNVYIIKK